MGHERVGVLPRTREWRALVRQIAATAEAPETVPAVASSTLLKVRQRFDRVSADSGFQAAFGFVVGLATAPPPAGAADLFPRIDLESNPSALRLTAQMRAWVDSRASSLKYAELAKRSAADVIAFWTSERSKQKDLFSDALPASQVWAGARNAGAFSDLCRVFLGKFTERYIKYFVEREASAHLPSVEARDRFAASLASHIDSIAQHSFETTKIAQSFAAGCGKQTRPTV